MRDAGLAPIFVLDELDKLDRSHADVDKLIERLKNLTTDYGFFCFLTGRSYYEEIFQRVGRSAYPKEFTYFSNLLFLNYRSHDFLRYLLSVVEQTPQTGSSQSDTRRQDAAAWMTFAFAARHRARLNSIALMRELARTFDEWGNMSEPNPTTTVSWRLQTAVQIAVDLSLEQVDVAQRLNGDPLFGQMAVDAAYRLSNAWENGDREVHLGPKQLAAYLATRGDGITTPPDPSLDPESGSASGAQADASKEVPATVTGHATEEELELLSQLAMRIADMLGDFDQLRAAANNYWTAERKDKILESLGSREFVEAGTNALGDIVAKNVLPAKLGGIVKSTEELGRYIFQVDPYGAEYARGVRVGPMDGPLEAKSLLALCGAILAAIQKLGFRISDLVEAQVLPGTIQENVLDQTMARVQNFLVEDVWGQDTRRDLPVLRSFADACVGEAARMTWSILLALLVSRSSRSAEKGLAALAKYISVASIPNPTPSTDSLEMLLREHLVDVPAVPIPQPFGRDPADIVFWAEALNKAASQEASNLRNSRDSDDAWEQWRRRLFAFLRRRVTPELSIARARTVPPPSYFDVVEAAEDRWPGGLFRHPLEHMSIMEWSRLARVAFPSPRRGDFSAPSWAFVAALAALRFDRGVLIAAADRIQDTTFASLVRDFPEYGADLGSILWIFTDGSATLANESIPAMHAGVVAISEADFGADKDGLIEWLVGLGQLKTVLRDVQ